MLTIRLQRRGRKNDPSFRLIVVDSKRAAKTGNFIEVLGNYDPRVDRVEIKAERIKHWMTEGATVSDTVHNILVNEKVIDAKKKNVLPKKTVPKPAATELSAEAPAQAGAPEKEGPAAEAAGEPAPAEESAPESAETAPEPQPEKPAAE